MVLDATDGISGLFDAITDNLTGLELVPLRALDRSQLALAVTADGTILRVGCGNNAGVITCSGDQANGATNQGMTPGFAINAGTRQLVKMSVDAGVTPAELRTAFQLIGNAELRNAADVDALSYETKRLHVKSLCSKLQCGGQRELSSKMVGQMVHLISVTDGSAEPSELLESFVARYLSNDVRLHLRRLPSGRLVWYLECLPSNGREVVLIHGIMFPNILYGLSKHLHAHNIKLMIPIRVGLLRKPVAGQFLRRRRQHERRPR